MFGKHRTLPIAPEYKYKVTKPLSCSADQPNKECSLVEQLREKQKELKELITDHDSIHVGLRALNSMDLMFDIKDYNCIEMFSVNDLTRGYISKEAALEASYAFKQYVDELEYVDKLIIKIDEKKKEIATLKQQLGIE